MPIIEPDAIIRADNYINDAERDVTPANDEGRVPKLESDAQLAKAFIAKHLKFGGSGADGALTVSSGATNIDLGGAKYFVKNYSSISITGTGYITFTNPHLSGTSISLKSKGAVTITTSATRAIDIRSLGGTNGKGWGGNSGGSSVRYVQVVGNTGFTTGYAGGGNLTRGTDQSYNAGSGSPSHAEGPLAGGEANPALSPYDRLVWPGGGGMNTGKGGGGLYIECGGALIFTGTIDASGTTEGAGGSVMILANTITTNTGTITVTGAGGGSVGQSLVEVNTYYE